MTRTVIAACTISFSVGETFDGGSTHVYAHAGEELIVVQEHATHLTVRKSGSNETFEIYTGQYR